MENTSAPVGGSEVLVEHDDSFEKEIESDLAEDQIPLQLDYQESHKFHYRDHFFSQEHFLFLSSSDSNILAIKPETSTSSFHSLLFTATGTFHSIHPLPDCDLSSSNYEEEISPKKLLEYVQSTTPELSTAQYTFQKSDSSLSTSILHYESQILSNLHKFGILLAQPSQSVEKEFYNNLTSPTPFQDFLNLLADRITLSGYSGYNGGLDTHSGSNLTGTHSYAIRDFQSLEIMFHVATELPVSDIDDQQIDKKRHIGNDIVILIFKNQNEDEPFNKIKLSTFRSQFNHVWIIVSPVGESEWHVEVYRKAEIRNVKESGPPIPVRGIIKNPTILRDWILCKLVNSERMCFKSTNFERRFSKVRSGQLHYLIERYSNDFRKRELAIVKEKTNFDERQINILENEFSLISGKKFRFLKFEDFVKIWAYLRHSSGIAKNGNKKFVKEEKMDIDLLRQFFESVDKNGDGEIEFSELTEVIWNLKSDIDFEDRMKFVYGVLSGDGKREITVSYGKNEQNIKNYVEFLAFVLEEENVKIVAKDEKPGFAKLFCVEVVWRETEVSSLRSIYDFFEFSSIFDRTDGSPVQSRRNSCNLGNSGGNNGQPRRQTLGRQMTLHLLPPEKREDESSSDEGVAKPKQVVPTPKQTPKEKNNSQTNLRSSTSGVERTQQTGRSDNSNTNQWWNGLYEEKCVTM